MKKPPFFLPMVAAPSPRRAARSTVLSCLCAALVAWPAAADAQLLLHYSFEGMGGISEGGSVPNVAPGATVDGTIFFADQLSLVDTPAVGVAGVRYELGQGLEFAPLNLGDSGTAAPHIDTNFLLSGLNIRGNTAYTAMAWINFADQGGDNMVFGTSFTDNALHLGSRDANYYSGHWGDDTSAASTDVGNWHHVAFTNDGPGGTQTIVVDGVQLVSGAGGTNNNPADSNLLIGTSMNGGAFNGIVDEVRVYNTLLTPAQIQAASVEGLQVVQLPAISSAIVTHDGVTLEVNDFETSSVVNESTITLSVSGIPAAPASYSVSKADGVTTIAYTWEPGLPRPYTSYTFTVDGETIDAESFSDQIAVRAIAVPETLPGGPGGSVGMWDVQHWKSAGIPGGNDAYPAAWDLITAGNPPDAEEMRAVIDERDFDTNGPTGVFTPEDPIVGDTEGVDDNNYATYARTKVQIDAPGPYTFSVRTDDGFCLHIPGATFTQVAGAAQNAIDMNAPSTVLFPIPTGDSDCRAVAQFDAAGTYDVYFMYWENGGGAFAEVAWSQGANLNYGDTGGWQLVGDPTGRPSESLWGDIPESLMPEFGEGNWGLTWWYGATNGAGQQVDNLDQTMRFLRDLEAGTATFSDTTTVLSPVLNYGDNQGGGIIPGGKLEFPNSPAPGANDRVAVLARARIQFPESGRYTIQVRSDDGFLFRFKDAGPTFVRVNSPGGTLSPGAPNEMYFAAGTGDANTRGILEVEAGVYEACFVWWEGGGGAFFEVSAAMGEYPNSADTCDWVLIGGSSQSARSLATTETGWSGQFVGPNYMPNFTAPAFDSQVEPALDAVIGNPAFEWSGPAFNFTDPQTNGCGAAVPGVVPWPGDTPADDNHYAVRGSATLVITQEDDYYIGFQGDDGSYLVIEGEEWLELVENATGQSIIDESNLGSGVFDRIFCDIGTGNSRTVGRIRLTPGNYTIRHSGYEMGGGSYFTVFGTDSASYVNGGFIPAIMVGGGDIVSTPPGLKLVGTPFTVTSFTRDPQTGDLTIVFSSTAGTDYSVEASSTMKNDEWLEVEDTTADSSSTTIQISAATLDALFGEATRNIFIRVRQL